MLKFCNIAKIISQILAIVSVKTSFFFFFNLRQSGTWSANVTLKAAEKSRTLDIRNLAAVFFSLLHFCFFLSSSPFSPYAHCNKGSIVRTTTNLYSKKCTNAHFSWQCRGPLKVNQSGVKSPSKTGSEKLKAGLSISARAFQLTRTADDKYYPLALVAIGFFSLGLACLFTPPRHRKRFEQAGACDK